MRHVFLNGAALNLTWLVIGCAPQIETPSNGATALVSSHQELVEHRFVPATGTEHVFGAIGPQRVRPSGSRELGKASYYGPEFTGRKMANGRHFDPASTSVAHRTLPFGTIVLVKNLGNGRATTATVEDRGPFIQGRIIDLSPRLAEHLGMTKQGVAPVEVMPVELAEAADPRP